MNRLEHLMEPFQFKLHTSRYLNIRMLALIQTAFPESIITLRDINKPKQIENDRFLIKFLTPKFVEQAQYPKKLLELIKIAFKIAAIVVKLDGFTNKTEIDFLLSICEESYNLSVIIAIADVTCEYEVVRPSAKTLSLMAVLFMCNIGVEPQTGNTSMLEPNMLSQTMQNMSFCPMEEDKLVGYYSSFNGAIGDGKFDIEDIDPHLYTHLIFAFVGINNNGQIDILHSDTNSTKRFDDLKTKNKEFKVMVAIRGGDLTTAAIRSGDDTSSKIFSEVARDVGVRRTGSKRRALIDNAVQFIKEYGFDGFDFDWEFPGSTGDSQDKGNFVVWLQEFRREFNKHGFLLTAGVSGSVKHIADSYNVPEINTAVDFINLMSYDINGPWTSPTGHNAPISEVGRQVENWIAAGMSPQKIVMGVATYGHSYTLANARNNGVGAASIGLGKPGPYANAPGALLYNEIVEYINTRTWTLKYDNKERVPYMYKGNQWVSYDDERSVTFKVKYARSTKLGGIMIWSIDMDDFKGKSGEVNQLQKTIRRNMKFKQSKARKYISKVYTK